MNTIDSEESEWDKYVNQNEWRSSKPDEPKPPKNKLEEFMDQLQKKINEMNDTAKNVKDTAGKLDPVVDLLDYIGRQDNELYTVTYGLIDLLGVDLGKEDRLPNGNYILMQIAAPDGYTRSSVCYTLHVENNVTKAQRGILTPLLEANASAVSLLMRRYNANRL